MKRRCSPQQTWISRITIDKQMNESKFQKLISGWLDSSLSTSEKLELEQTLREDINARQFYLEHMSVHAELCSLESAQEYFDSLGRSGEQCDNEECYNEECYNEVSPAHRTRASTSRSWWPYSIAVGLLIAVGIWQGTVQLNQEHRSTLADSRILDAVSPASEDCLWYVEQARRGHVNSYVSGDVLRVTRGKLELKYAHGTKVVLHAPAAYQLITKMKSRVLLGRLTATVTEAAKGFSVLTPRATVVDLGTQFGVEVNNDGATDVVVFKGEVDVDYHDQTDQANAQRLSMGEAVHLDAVGTASRIVSINGRNYSDESLDALSRPAVISEVHDNIERDSPLMSYYEIVHQGMREDALAFVDRIAHEWNGIDAKGMPAYLIGADYVKTFNSDKFNQEIKVSVNVDVPCKLYVLFDNRLSPPEWLRRDFLDTGDDIGLDNGPFQTTGKNWHNKGPSGVGPGESIDDSLSVWVKLVADPCVVFLGSTEAPKSEPNMYGIAAVPLNAR